MAVLITGGSGFVGLAFVDASLRANEEVVAFSSGPPPPLLHQRIASLWPGQAPARLVCLPCGDQETERSQRSKRNEVEVHQAGLAQGQPMHV